MSKFVLRQYQNEAVEAGVQAVNAGKNGILSMPTGSGKSLVIAGIATALETELVVLQPTKEILEQNFHKLYDFGHRNIAICSASVGSKRRAQVTFATIGSVINRTGMFSNVSAVIVDECHLVNANNGQYLEFIEALGVPVIGLTATPYRMHACWGGALVQAKFLHRTRPRLFDHVAYIVQNNELHNDGYLCPINYVQDKSYDPYAIALKSTGLNYDEEALANYNRAKGICQQAVEVVVSNYDRIKHFLVFATSIEESKIIEDLLQKSGIDAAHVDGKTNKAKRENILADFKYGRTRVVVNVGVLTTGFDFPALDGIVLARPTMSLPLYYQMVGRGVRMHEGKEGCHVFDLCGNVDRFGRPEEYRIEAPNGKLHRLRSGDKFLTGINFVDGQDVETGEYKPAESKQKVNSGMLSRASLVPFGKYKGKRLSDLPTSYLLWCRENFGAGKVRDSFCAELNYRGEG